MQARPTQSCPARVTLVTWNFLLFVYKHWVFNNVACTFFNLAYLSLWSLLTYHTYLGILELRIVGAKQLILPKLKIVHYLLETSTGNLLQMLMF